MGNMLLFDRDTPDGYPENGPSWISAGTLVERSRFVQSFCIAAGPGGAHHGTTNDAGNCTCNVVGLLKSQLPATSWTNAGAVADCFLGLPLPGRRRRQSFPLPLRLAELTSTTVAPTAHGTTPFASLTVSSTAGSTLGTACARGSGIADDLPTIPGAVTCMISTY